MNETDVKDNKFMSVLAYLGILVLIPLICRKNSPYARFHTNQGLIVLAMSIFSNILGKLTGIAILGWVFSIVSLVLSVAAFVFAIVGIVHACKGEAKELPIVGGFQILKN